MRKLHRVVPRASFVTIYKVFVRPHLDNADIIFDKFFSDSFKQKMESVQYDADLEIARIIRTTSKKRLYQEAGFESLLP